MGDGARLGAVVPEIARLLPSLAWGRGGTRPRSTQGAGEGAQCPAGLSPAVCLEIARVNKHESRRETGGRGRDSTAWLCRAKVWEGKREREEAPEAAHPEDGAVSLALGAGLRGCPAVTWRRCSGQGWPQRDRGGGRQGQGTAKVWAGLAPPLMGDWVVAVP